MADDSTLSDADLISSTLHGSEEAFAQLVARHRTRVLQTAARFARHQHEMDDLAQEIFLRMYKRLRQFRGEAPFTHWLARLTTTTCYDFLRRERRTREQVPLDLITWEVADAAPEAAARVLAARELLAHLMRQLLPEEQLILTLCELEERPLTEVAQLTGWSLANVKVRAFRARARLKTLLANEPTH